MKDFWKRKRNKRIAASALAVVMAGFLVWGLFPWQAAAAETTVADDVTINNWHDPEALDDSTKNVGRIWTDKSVSTGDVTLTKPGQTEPKTIQKNGDSDFLVGLSALSSTAEIMGQTTVPLDIVLVLDVSGSMDDYSGGYQEVYQLDTNKTYYIYSYSYGRYREVKYDNQSQRWYYQNYGQWHYVSPKTSAEDSDRNHRQFYSDGRVKKIDTLKKAVNGFIEQTALENDNRSDVNKQSRISLVKFAGNKTNAVGDSTYKDDKSYKHNYTQIVSEYEACTSANKDKLKSKVGALTPAGATAADYAMERAQALVNQSKADETASSDRKNVKRIVIFFTDGEPNHNSGFDDEVADAAINAAKNIKKDASIYTIGVFNDADASVTGHTGWDQWSDKERFNAYMHGMSSNYPKATTYENLGERAKDSQGNNTQFYKAATDAAKLYDIFKEIQEEIVTSAQSPTHVEQGEDPHQSGYITFTDQLGDYMQVDDMNTLLYADQMLTSETKGYSRTETTAGNKTTVKYTFDYVIPDTNHVYPEGNLKNIVITVEKATGDDQLHVGDLVTVKIPASLIPLRYYQIDKDGKMTIDETYPMRLFYDVSLKADAEKKLENPDATMRAYINANKNSDGQVQFYSNKYKAGVNDNPETIGAYSHFVPATTNDFYYFQEDAPLYTNKECTKAAKEAIDTSGDTTYYYQRDYYKLENGETKKEKNTVTIPGNSNIILGDYVKKKEGQYYIRAGAPRTTSLTYFTENKGENQTGTARTFIKPTWNYKELEKGVTVYLGNNGRISKDVPGALEELNLADVCGVRVTKVLYGHDMAERQFEFSVTADNDASASKLNNMTLYSPGADSGAVATILEKLPITLTQSDIGITYSYTFAEKQGKAAGYTYDENQYKLKITTIDNGNGTLKANVVLTNTTTDKKIFDETVSNKNPAKEGIAIGFENRYDGSTDDVDVNVTGRKTLSHAEGLNPNDIAGKFSFKLEAVTDGAPMPKNTTVTNDAAGNIDFGEITFDLNLLKDVPSASDTDQSGDVEQPGEGEQPAEVDKSRTKTFKYKVTETGSAAGVTNDSAKTKTFKLILTDDGNGNLTVTSDPKEGPKFTFTNTYTVDKLPSSITDQIKIDKNLTGRDLKEGEFTFELLEDGQVVATGSNDASGNVTFNKIKYAEPGQHTYTVREVNNDLGGVTYDDQLYTVHTTITDNRDGTMNAKHKAFAVIDGKELAPVDEITFTNKYEAKGTMASIGAVKRLTGKDLKDGQFTFQLKDENGKVIDEAKNDKAGAISFKALEFDKAGTYKYTISEVNDKQKEIKYDTSEKTVTITVKDSGDGYLQAQVESEKQLIFTNTFEAAGGSGTKTGDNMNLVLPIMMMLTAAAIGSVLLIRRKYHR